ncbi:MAG: metalloregulator ArsR/SmtB family transcription factor [Lachnospiraceae bacterium]|nr:metalloregulator ArsR/SmtB family transcription factor [Lachnospiraceae bacterium]
MGRKEDEKIAPCCEFMYVHEHVVEKVMEVMPEEEELQDLAEFFRVFADSTRIRILYALSQSELCVCDIASLLGMGQSAISHQLRILKQMRLVKFRRDGKSVLYSLADSHIETILAQGMEHIGE